MICTCGDEGSYSCVDIPCRFPQKPDECPDTAKLVSTLFAHELISKLNSSTLRAILYQF